MSVVESAPSLDTAAAPHSALIPFSHPAKEIGLFPKNSDIENVV